MSETISWPLELLTLLKGTEVFGSSPRVNKCQEKSQQSLMTLMYPEIWRRDMSDKKPRVMDITNITSPPSDRICLVFYEESASLKSRALVQSLMGLSNIPDTPEANKVYYFGRMNICEMLKRFSRQCDKEIRTKLPEVIDFLYIGYAATESLNRLSHVLGSRAFWVTSQMGIKANAPRVHSPTGVYVFTVTKDCFETSRVIYPESFVQEVKTLTGRCRGPKSADKSVYLPVYSSNLAFDGPLANVSLRYSCRYIFGDEELHKLQTNSK